MMKKATQEEAVAVTSVFWDINMCPVPAGCDPRLVRPCIRRLLEKNGYCGPLTVTAIGKLGDVPIDILRGVYSSGIALINVPHGSSDITDLIDFTENNPPPANFMFISYRKACPGFFKLLRMWQYNPLQPFPYDSLESLIMKDSGALEEDTGESALWECLVCARDPPGQGFENFTTHLFSEEHQELMLSRNFVPPSPPLDPAMVLLREYLTQHDRMRSYVVPVPTVASPSGYCDIDWEAIKSESETFVFWDINLCPVPPGCDASLVGPCIKRFLKKEGCYGPLTIIAIGLLTDVPIDILRKVYSSGISLHNVPYGPSDTANLISDLSHRTGPLRNIMVISTAKIFACESGLLQLGCNLLKPFPNDSLQSICLAADSGGLEEYKCNGMDEFAFWICSVCDHLNFPFQGFESFTMHLFGTYHQQKLSELLPICNELRSLNAPLSEPPEINLEAVTSVFWDIKTCPVPPGCDPRRVGPCIKRFLENRGYSGPLTITAIGVLTDVPIDILRGVYSSGIALKNVPYGFSDGSNHIFGFTLRNPSPANILIICDAKLFDSDYAFNLQSRGYNLFQPFPCDSLQSFFLADSGALEEDKCSETSESAFWICSVCHNLRGQGFENFITHVTSRRHQRKLLDW